MHMAGTLVCCLRVISFSVDVCKPHVPCRKCTTQKNICIHSKRVCANKAACQLFCSSSLFCFWELNRFLKISIRDPRKILQTRNSKLDPRNSSIETRALKLEHRNSILDSRKLRGSRIEFRVETVNLPLSGTVWIFLVYKCFFTAYVLCSLRLFKLKTKAKQYKQKTSPQNYKLKSKFPYTLG